MLNLFLTKAATPIINPTRAGRNSKSTFSVSSAILTPAAKNSIALSIRRCKPRQSLGAQHVRQPNSFWLQTSSDKFYPDFVALLNDGRVLVVEYKGRIL